MRMVTGIYGSSRNAREKFPTTRQAGIKNIFSRVSDVRAAENMYVPRMAVLGKKKTA